MITVQLSRDELVERRACDEGMALFDSLGNGDDIIEAEWTLLHSIWLSVAYPGFAEWLRDQGLIPGIHLYGANLTRAYLEGAYLTRANLEGAYLEGAYLEGAYLTRANLTRANLTRANLEGANLEGANLEGANLEGAYWPALPAPPAGWKRTDSGLLVREVAA